MNGKKMSGALIALALLAAAATLFAPAARPASASSMLSVQQTGSGLVTSDPLTTGNTSLWTFGGSAAVYGAPYAYYEDSSGLHIGVQPNTAGQWAGYYAARGESAGLFHATLSLPSSTLAADQSFNTGLYVQTGGSNVDYVTCAGEVDQGGYAWSVVQATGNQYGATQFNTLWFEWMNGQPLTRGCTIVTNGSNMLQVYLDGSLVYSSSSMNLGYQYPLTTFLEVQSTDNTTMHYSTYTDYYATTSGNITVNGAPAGSTVQLIGASGAVLASGRASLSGTAVLDVTMYNMPLSANIVVTDLGVTVASTSSPAAIYGGDAYALTAGSGSTLAPTSGPYTANPTISGDISTSVGQGIGLLPGPSSGDVCLLGICL